MVPTVALVLGVFLAFLGGLALGLAAKGAEERPQGQQATFQTLEELAPLPRIDMAEGAVPQFGPPELRRYAGTSPAVPAEQDFYGKDWAWPERMWCAVGKHDLAPGQRYCAVPILNAHKGAEIAICAEHMEVAGAQADDA